MLPALALSREQELSGQVGIVTGGGRGIGRAITLALVEAGAAVGILARSRDQIDETIALATEIGGRVHGEVCDVRDTDSVGTAVASCTSTLGPVDLLVNNAGSNQSIGPVWEVDAQVWWDDVTTNLLGPFLCSRAVLPAMLARGSGRIVNIVSHATLGPVPYDTAYSSSKTALIRFTESMAAEVADHGISVFALSPGSVDTALNRGVHQSPGGQRWLGGQKAGLTFVPVDLPASAVAFLAGGAGDGLSGRFFHVSDDVRSLAARAAEIRKDDLFQLRLVR